MSHDFDHRHFGVASPGHLVHHGHAPGKNTLTQQLAPVQMKKGPDAPAVGGMSPTAVQVCQLDPDTDARSYNDCGPSTVLMAIKAMGLEPTFDSVVAIWDDPIKSANKLALEKKFDFIRHAGHLPLRVDNGPTKSVTDTMNTHQVEQCLLGVLERLGLPKKEAEKYVQSFTPSHKKGAPNADVQATDFVLQHCGGDSAVIALGAVENAAWGWGGLTQDFKGKRKFGDAGGGHFVFIWRVDAGAAPREHHNAERPYVVMDPSWGTPRFGISLQEVMTFMDGMKKYGVDPVELLAVPFVQIAARVHDWVEDRPGGHAAGHGPVQNKADGARGVALPAPTDGGNALPEATRVKMEHALGADFTNVRIHEDAHVAAAGALAYARGEHVYFAPGRYAPGTRDGDRLLGHELAHVVQQRHGRVNGAGVVDDAALEAEADALGEHASSEPLPRIELRDIEPKR